MKNEVKVFFFFLLLLQQFVVVVGGVIGVFSSFLHYFQLFFFVIVSFCPLLFQMLQTSTIPANWRKFRLWKVPAEIGFPVAGFGSPLQCYMCPSRTEAQLHIRPSISTFTSTSFTSTTTVTTIAVATTVTAVVTRIISVISAIASANTSATLKFLLFICILQFPATVFGCSYTVSVLFFPPLLLFHSCYYIKITKKKKVFISTFIFR